MHTTPLASIWTASASCFLCMSKQTTVSVLGLTDWKSNQQSPTQSIDAMWEGLLVKQHKSLRDI